jgi:hypothetical protein
VGENKGIGHGVCDDVVRRNKHIGTWESSGENTVRKRKAFCRASRSHFKFFARRIAGKNAGRQRWSVGSNPDDGAVNYITIEIAAEN